MLPPLPVARPSRSPPPYPWLSHRRAGFQCAFTIRTHAPEPLDLRFTASFYAADRRPRTARQLLQSISVPGHNCRIHRASPSMTRFPASLNDSSDRAPFGAPPAELSRTRGPFAIANEHPPLRSLARRLRPSSIPPGHPLSQPCCNAWPEKPSTAGAPKRLTPRSPSKPCRHGLPSGPLRTALREKDRTARTRDAFRRRTTLNRGSGPLFHRLWTDCGPLAPRLFHPRTIPFCF